MRHRSAGSGVNSVFAEGRLANTGVDGAGPVLEHVEMHVEGSVVHELLTNFAARAAAVGKSQSLPRIFSRNRGFSQQFAPLLRHALIDRTKGNMVEGEVGGTHRKCSRNGVETNMNLTHEVGWINNSHATNHRALHKDR